VRHAAPTIQYQHALKPTQAFLAPSLDPKELTLLFEFEDGATFQVSGKEAIDLYLHSERSNNVCETLSLRHCRTQAMTAYSR